MYSIIHDGKVLDYRFIKRKTDTVFKCGEILMGQLFKIGKRWSAVSCYPTTYGVIKGFATRLDAAEYLIQVFNYQQDRTPVVWFDGKVCYQATYKDSFPC